MPSTWVEAACVLIGGGPDSPRAFCDQPAYAPPLFVTPALRAFFVGLGTVECVGCEEVAATACVEAVRPTQPRPIASVADRRCRSMGGLLGPTVRGWEPSAR